MTAERLEKIERDPNGVGCLGTVRDLIHDLRLVRERAERLERGVMHHANDGCAKCAADLAASTQEDE